ncbi:MAG: shikimate kinase [Gloeobacterales cyanobacterium]
MRVFITGVSCVGKTTVGEKLAALLGCPFYDLDAEIESYFGTSIEQIQKRFLTMYSYRKEASKALKQVLSREDSRNCVIVLPPSGLMDSYWRLVKKANATTVVLEDSAENILDRITFYDIDSRPIEKKLSEREKQLYLREIKGDISYFRPSYQRANVAVAIAGLGAKEAAQKVRHVLESIKKSGV